jgi:hypothetical protein
MAKILSRTRHEGLPTPPPSLASGSERQIPRRRSRSSPPPGSTLVVILPFSPNALSDTAGLIAEPSGAAGVAAVMANRERFAALDARPSSPAATSIRHCERS